MSGPKKGVIPPHLKKFLFKKGRGKKKRAAKRTALHRAVDAFKRVKRKRQRNPKMEPASSRDFALFLAKPNGPIYRWTGRKFQVGVNPATFPSLGDAQAAGKTLMKSYGRLFRGFTMWAAGKNSNVRP